MKPPLPRSSHRQASIALALAAALLGAASVRGQSVQGQTQGGTLSAIVQPEPPTLMLGLNQQAPTIYVAGKIYQGLLTYDAQLRPQPALARSWKASSDGLSYTFELQRGVKWHDGKPFSAADVVFSVDKFLRTAHPRSRLVINRYLDSITAIGEHGVEFKLKEPFSPFMSLFVVDNMPMIPKHIYEGSDFYSNPANQTPIGTGPFKFKEWKKGSHIVLTRNPDYWKKGLPCLDEIVFRVIPDAASRAVAFEKGDVQLLRGGDVDNVDIKRLKALPNVTMSTRGWEMYAPLAFISMNQRRPPFDNLKVRQAVMHAINRKFIVDNIFFGMGKIATGPIASTTLYYDQNVPQYAFDLRKARALIQESGVNVGATPVRILSFPYGSAWDRLAEYTRQSLEQIGFKVQIEPADAGGWAKRLGDFDFDLTFNFTYQYGDPALGVARHFLSTNAVKGSPFVNNQGYRNPKVDALFANAAAARSPELRQKLYSEVQNILMAEVANGVLFEIENATFHQKHIRNLVQTGIGLNESFDDVCFDKK
ncbi:ABC transporter substrate-binding protein [Verminephrobacter aporrectodeae]|uniref:ABC transporter substrate-binding protein n=1 Tax=Verminephrobacter aporrectodeae subsp. tuberculatae TaxID=1110392 RepID=A0ABT3KPQ7_9BURK|nr:ABC transporter substrate-binding protein [Verminephrobacter aporrectodeae]MCW5319909.1 ABC transporter substrate-binding protein [Verminephrobacter aporrectodeae subsp. tuberculatae]MCW8177346.1 ABC transporter substrate-binding protein [Verminephrobacter aporrectodeae subsp. tuberculatae]MCW8204858.1 ABC transporter substrate-binding protein [Verminephrobacter aporrectodeae subsp. tuberculatae]MCW8209138.1 ABC transporter substrate-binding protein [Verminephrobacter aporrectodeae subsp. tu